MAGASVAHSPCSLLNRIFVKFCFSVIIEHNIEPVRERERAGEQYIN
jgi:hypothetical protein